MAKGILIAAMDFSNVPPPSSTTGTTRNTSPSVNGCRAF
jgi:hypothetical protein